MAARCCRCDDAGSAITSKLGGDIANSRISWHTEVVPEFCTCGARLPEDARFCHKCGKPQRDEPLMVEEARPPPPFPRDVPVVLAPPIGFHNGPAVRIGLL